MAGILDFWGGFWPGIASGFVVGALLGWCFYRLSTRALNNAVDGLKGQVVELGQLIDSLQAYQRDISDRIFAVILGSKDEFEHDEMTGKPRIKYDETERVVTIKVITGGNDSVTNAKK